MQLRQQNAQEKSLNRILGAENTLLNPEKKNKEMMNSLKLEKEKKRKVNIIKNVKNIFRLKKEMNKNTINSIQNIFRLKKGKCSN